MAYNLKEIMATKPSRFTAGHRMCAGCGAPPVARMVMRALHEGDHAVVSNATGCMEVSTCIYPYTAWTCLLYTSPSPRDTERSRMPSSA